MDQYIELPLLVQKKIVQFAIDDSCRDKLWTVNMLCLSKRWLVIIKDMIQHLNTYYRLSPLVVESIDKFYSLLNNRNDATVAVSNILKRYRLDISGCSLKHFTKEFEGLITKTNLGHVKMIVDKYTTWKCVQQMVLYLNTRWQSRITSLSIKYRFKMVDEILDPKVYKSFADLIPLIKPPLRRYIVPREKQQSSVSSSGAIGPSDYYTRLLMAHKSSLDGLHMLCDHAVVRPTLMPYSSMFTTLSSRLVYLSIECTAPMDFTFINQLSALRKLRLGLAPNPFNKDETIRLFADAYSTNKTIRSIKLTVIVAGEVADKIASNVNLVRFNVVQGQWFSAINKTLKQLKYNQSWEMNDLDLAQPINDVQQMFKSIQSIEY
ncbi:hypothetical protein SAMD00019534_094830, partial [Acytostelium subglobosum LB1]|uniref:hypothetical protein n=1 Tax=Acytostelium subglobosum LB1 TaxID=1410327 RepID=UPI000644BBB1